MHLAAVFSSKTKTYSGYLVIVKGKVNSISIFNLGEEVSLYFNDLFLDETKYNITTVLKENFNTTFWITINDARTLPSFIEVPLCLNFSKLN